MQLKVLRCLLTGGYAVITGEIEMAAERTTTTDDRVGNASLTTISMGYFRSRVLCAAARLGVADALGADELSVADLAIQCGAEPRSLHRLLRALASIGVVAETKPGRFVLTPFGKPLRKDHPNSEWAAVVFWADLLADEWAYLTDCIRLGNSAAYVRPKDVASRWSREPNAHQILRAVMGTAPSEDYLPVVDSWNFSKSHVVADLGGGGGGLIAAILHAHQKIHGLLVDKEESVKAAATRIAQEGLTARCDLIAADLTEEVPAGADVYILKSVLHSKTDGEAIEILVNCRSVIPAEGYLLLIEFVLPEVVDQVDSYLETKLMSDLNMLAVTGGRERPAVDWKTMLDASGFELRSIIPVHGGIYSILEAVPKS